MKATQFNVAKLLGYRIAFQPSAVGAKLGGKGGSKLGNKGGTKAGRKGFGQPA